MLLGVPLLVAVLTACGMPAGESGEPAAAPPAEVPTSTVVISDVSDRSDPASVTGVKIGDSVLTAPLMPPFKDGDVIDQPEWFAVASGDFVVGYLRNVSLDEVDGMTNNDLIIYDNDSQPIGAFIDGLPVIGKGVKPAPGPNVSIATVATP